MYSRVLLKLLCLLSPLVNLKPGPLGATFASLLPSCWGCLCFESCLLILLTFHGLQKAGGAWCFCPERSQGGACAHPLPTSPCCSVLVMVIRLPDTSSCVIEGYLNSHMPIFLCPRVFSDHCRETLHAPLKVQPG